MNIPFFDYKNIFVPYKDDLLKITEEIITSGQYIFGKELEKFENRCVQKLGCKYAIGVGNATDAIEILLQAHGIPKGAEILISSHTMSATASAIVSVGGTPVPVDIDKFGMMDASKLENRITSKTWAIMPTQLNGAIAEMSEISKLAHKYSLHLFEDSAQAFGASYYGTNAGNFGNGGVFSFYPAKVLACLGDGGMIVVNSASINEKVRSIRDHGRSASGTTTLSGRNSRLDNLQAAYLNYFLNNHFDDWIKRRKELTDIYDQILGGVSGIITPQYNNRPEHISVYQNYELLAENRDELRQYLLDSGVSTLKQWGGYSIHQIEIFSGKLKLKNTEEYFDRYLMLPLNQGVTTDQAYFISNIIKKFYGDKNIG